MKKYEYKYFKIHGGTINRYPSKDEIEKTLNKLGQRGWRLVRLYHEDEMVLMMKEIE